MGSGVNFIIYFYLFICIALLIFNLIYLLSAKGKSRARRRKGQRWRREIEAQKEQEMPGAAHLKKLGKRLKRIEELMAYHEAVLGLKKENETQVQGYLDGCALCFQALGVEYGKKEAMERAFYAHIISVYHPNREAAGGRLIEILLSYFENSSVFCRENILQALYAMGRSGPIERAFMLMSNRGWYHHARLLSDGLATFAGDKEALAWKLWKNCGNFAEPFQVAVVQFAMGVSAAFAEEFLAALQEGSLPLETRFALARYFQRWSYEPAEPVLRELLQKEEASGLSIAAASVLAKYPGKKSEEALMEALHSRNWYVRRNAASSLSAIGITMEAADAIRNSGDRYAAEMLEYALEG